MAVKAKYEKQADIPESLKSDYKEVGGAWLLDVEGGNPLNFVPKTEFENVLQESKDRKAKLKLFGDMDPERAKADLAELVELRKGAGNTEVQIKAATARMQTELESERTAKKTLEAQLSKLLLDDTFKSVAAKAGVRPDALDYFVGRARQDFEVVNGELVPRNSLKGKDGKPLTPDEWGTERKADSAFLFEGSSGGGAHGNNGGGASGGNGSKPNPYKKGPTFNMTAQGLLEIEDPAAAARMKAEAGV